MSPPVKILAPLLLALAAAAPAAEPVVVKESDVVFPSFFGMGRKVDSETLILPGASAVIRQQSARDRYTAMREARGVAEREQQRQAEARRKAEAEAMSDVAPAPADAASAEAAMAGASSEPAPEEPVAGASATHDSADATEPAAAAEEPVAEEPDKVAVEPVVAEPEAAASAKTAPSSSD